MSEQQKIDIHVQSGTGEVLRIAATLLLFGGAGAIAWAVAQGPNAEMAATGFAMMLVMMIRLAYGAGRISAPARQGDGPDDFATTKSTIAQIAAEYRNALARANMPVVTLVAIGYAIAFLVLRAGVSAALGIFSNLFIAGGFAAMVGAIVVFPSLLPSILALLKRTGVVTDAPAAQPSAPVPVQQVTPAPAVPAPEPVQQIEQQTAAPKKIVRRVKKEQSDV